MGRKDFYTPPEIARLLGVNSDRVRNWIYGDELVAFNVADPGRRPRWRISHDAFHAFMAKRSNYVPAKPARKRPPSLVKEWV